ncbi:hypothetical protein DEJ49_33640 [Streptomyces venezuelae]|uniref:Uncharacterized protein n=1 Tax=Streptomyces venezuelae TaxID=54571 RepID=A0A5P2CS92_STRVZ|nr:hypothetical protein [Streptomyces venezuelae]QES45283.1 hypothetical protein DEJ49_33640 [Streptomyces venezuelae]
MTETDGPKKRGRPATGSGEGASVRVASEVKAAFDGAVAAAGSNRSKVTEQLWAWFAGMPGAKLPERPGDAKPPVR